MSKPLVGRSTTRKASLRAAASLGCQVAGAEIDRHNAEPGEVVISKARFEAIMEAARETGLLGEKVSRIAGRVSPRLVEQAKRQTGIKTDTDLVEFALATVALEDHFAQAFEEARGKVDPDLKLGY